MIALILFLFGATAMGGDDPGVGETCAFLPVGTPCPPLPPTEPHCIIRNGVEICT